MLGIHNFLTLQREEIISIEGKKIAADPHPITCLVFSGINGNKFGVKIVPQDHPESRKVVLDKDHVVWIDMKDCRERLLLDPNEQIEGELEAYVQNTNLPLVLNNYERLQSKDKNYNPALLIRMVKTAFAYRNLSQPHGVYLSAIEPLKAFLGKYQRIIAGFKGNKLTLVDITRNLQEWKGGESTVTVFPALPHKKEVVAKVYHRAIGLMKPKNELLSLERLHINCSKPFEKCVPGIQKPHRGLVVVDSDVYVLQSKYKHISLNLIPSLSLDDKLIAFYRLLRGLHICFTKQVFIHRDIKPDNILARIDKVTGKLVFDLADFGTALFDDTKIDRSGHETPAFIRREDSEQRKLLEKSLSCNLNPAEKITYIEIAHKADIFALGIIFANLLVNGSFKLFPWGFPELDALQVKFFLEQEVPLAIRCLIQYMLVPVYTHRFDSLAVLKVLEAILIDRKLLKPDQKLLESNLSLQEFVKPRDRLPPPQPVKLKPQE